MKEDRKDMLIPVDFSEEAIFVIDNTIHLTSFIKGSITLLYVIYSGDAFQQLFVKKDEVKRIETEARQKLEQIAEDVRSRTNLEVNIRIEKGKVSKVIIDVADELKPRYIVLAKKGPYEGGEKMLGANFSKIIRQSNHPVLVVPTTRDCRVDYHRILVPMDLTKTNRVKAYSAMAFALHYKADVNLVAVLRGDVKIRKSHMYRKLKRYKKTFEDNGIKCEFKIYPKMEKKNIAKTLLEYAKEVDADLMIIMPHRETLLNENYIGSVAYKVINDTHIPLISLTPVAAENENEAVMKSVIDPFDVFLPKDI